jgi:hypothetical protein
MSVSKLSEDSREVRLLLFAAVPHRECADDYPQDEHQSAHGVPAEATARNT